jgi:ATP/maltotriose-dependent transcriptional regulator MalT
MRHLARRRLAGLSSRARHLLVTAAVLGPSFRLEDAADMLGQAPAALLPTLEEANNRQIAGRMYVSVNTVAFYMRQIFRKLSIDSRVELARIVIEQPRGRAQGVTLA